MKLNKTKNKKGASEASVEVEVESPEVTPIDITTPEPDISSVMDEVAPAPVEVVAQIPAVSVPTVKEGYVKIVMLAEINPSPTIGHYDCVRELKVGRMKSGESYFVPMDVALVLMDSKKAVIQS